MKSYEETADEAVWRNCTPGELVELATRHRHREERRTLLRSLSLAAAGCAVAGTLSVVWSQRRERPFAPGGIVCDEVTRLLPAYAAHQLDAERTAQVQKHLTACSHCR